jgi:hypothetical protein
MGQVQKCTFSLPKWVQIMPHAAPKNAEFQANVTGLDITASILHSDEVQGALNWVNS